ncbi:MAG TPA: PEP-CTERM sorting domain-containing protein [Opitutales bacterium]|nr:PEP-CTERM sorting domain-containing protein [Opitutales bacterium]
MSVFKSKLPKHVCRVFLFSSLTLAASAQIDLNSLGLFNTGVNGTGQALDDLSVDPHYTIITRPDNSQSTDAYVIQGHQNWADNGQDGTPDTAFTAASRWINPYEVDPFNGTAAVGTWTYKLSFDLSAIKSDLFTVDGIWSSDNAGSEILLNGSAISGTSTPTNAFENAYQFTLGGQAGIFETGLNTLQFTVNNASGNGGNPTGLRVEFFDYAVHPVPEPAHVGFLALVAMLGFLMIRRRKRS